MSVRPAALSLPPLGEAGALPVLLPPPLGEDWGGGQRGWTCNAVRHNQPAPIPAFPQGGKEQARTPGR